MIGIANYSSSEEEKEDAKAKSPAKPAPAAAPPAAVEPVPQSKAAPKPATKASAKTVDPKKLAEIKKEVGAAKSATAVVQVVRQSMENWDRRWGALALYQIAKKSTARTRQEWAGDKSVMRIANKLKAESSAEAIPAGRLAPEDAEVALLSLEGLRRMVMQGKEEQKPALELLVTRLADANWSYPVKTLTRLYWLAAPLKLEGVNAVPDQLRPRCIELGGSDLSLLIASMRLAGAKDLALLEKVIGRLKEKDIHKTLSATDLVEMSEGLAELDQRDEEVLRPMGQELQRRRGELTPDEAHRIQTAFQTLKLPLSKVWAPVGSTTKRGASGIVTTQAFAPQQGHEKKRRGNNDVERTSPPRVVRDYKMCSY